MALQAQQLAAVGSVPHLHVAVDVNRTDRAAELRAVRAEGQQADGAPVLRIVRTSLAASTSHTRTESIVPQAMREASGLNVAALMIASFTSSSTRPDATSRTRTAAGRCSQATREPSGLTARRLVNGLSLSAGDSSLPPCDVPHFQAGLRQSSRFGGGDDVLGDEARSPSLLKRRPRDLARPDVGVDGGAGRSALLIPYADLQMTPYRLRRRGTPGPAAGRSAYRPTPAARRSRHISPPVRLGNDGSPETGA